MIETIGNLTGEISTRLNLKGELNKGVEVITPNTQSKTIEPKTIEQTITPDEGVFALSSVTVNPVTNNIDENIKAENIKKGTSILGVEGTLEPFRKPILQDKTVNPTTEIQEIMADEGYDALNKVVVNAQTGVDINEYLETTITSDNVQYLFAGKIFKKMPKFTLATTECTFLFAYYRGDILPEIDTSNVKNFSNMFVQSTVQEIPELDASNATNVNQAFSYCRELITFGGMKNLGQSYLTTISENNASYSLRFSESTKLTEQSMINILNNLYDIATKGCKAQRCVVGSANLAKLTSEAGQQALSNAQAKGWTIS